MLHLNGIGPNSDAGVARVRFIKSAQGLGFSLADITALLGLDDGTHCMVYFPWSFCNFT